MRDRIDELLPFRERSPFPDRMLVAPCCPAPEPLNRGDFIETLLLTWRL